MELFTEKKTVEISVYPVGENTFSMPRCSTNWNCARTKSSTDSIGNEAPYALFVLGLIDEGPLESDKQLHTSSHPKSSNLR